MFTPGPWKIQDITRIVDKNDNYIGSVSGYYTTSVMPGIHNAKLIVNAPEFYEFVQYVLNEQLSHGEHGDAELISKAQSLLERCK